MIRIVRRQDHPGGIGLAFRFAVLPPTELELSEDGLVGGRLLPVAAVIELARRDEVVVGLALVGDEVPGIAEELGDQLDRLGDLVAVVVGRVSSTFAGRGLATVVVYPKGGLVHSADHRRATGRTNGGGNEGVFATNAFPCHAVDMRGLDQGFAIAPDMRGCILDYDPYNVRSGRSLAEKGGEKEN